MRSTLGAGVLGLVCGCDGTTVEQSEVNKLCRALGFLFSSRVSNCTRAFPVALRKGFRSRLNKATFVP